MMRSEVEQQWFDGLRTRLPKGFDVQDVVTFDYQGQIGASITNGARRWASRVSLAHIGAMDEMIKALSRAWTR